MGYMKEFAGRRRPHQRGPGYESVFAQKEGVWGKEVYKPKELKKYFAAAAKSYIKAYLYSLREESFCKSKKHTTCPGQTA